MARLKQHYLEKIVPKLTQKFNYRSVMAVPRLEKAVVTIGTSKALKDAKLFDIMIQNLRQITGQQPVKTLAKSSISNFNIKKGLTVGLKVTLRRNRMYDFVDKLINVTLPRVRDFQGLSAKGFDERGNYSLGFKEHLVFPEIQGGAVEKIHGLGITIKTTAKSKKETYEFLKELGFPFKKEEKI